MAKIVLENVNLIYPLLGGGINRKVEKQTKSGAGAIVQDSSFRSRGIVALSDISLDLRDGDRVGLVGRNGSGKSTLLRVLAGIYEPFEGHMKVEGKIASLFSAGLGMKADLSGYRNIELASLMAGFVPRKHPEKLEEIAEFSGLGHYLQMPVRTYSNGMGMRLKFACATAFEPEILLMDEWLGAGDPEFQKKAHDRMRALVERAGILVLASHNHKQVLRECNKALWLDRGVMKAFGNVKEVIAAAEAG